MSRWLQEILGSFDAYATEKGVTLKLNAPEQSIMQVPLEAMESIVQNLVSNALQHAPPGSAVSVDFSSEQAVGVLQISDEGPGIPPQSHRQVFDRFYRGSPDGGAGLGLSIVAAAAQRMGGEVTLTSTPPAGQGLRVTVRWPMQSP